MTAGRDPDAAITARAQSIVEAHLPNAYQPFVHAVIVEALCAVRDETREADAKIVEGFSRMIKYEETDAAEIASAIRAGGGGAG